MDSVFRDIRRKDRVLSCDAAWKLLERGEYGFLAMQGMNGYGYGIPLSTAYESALAFGRIRRSLPEAERLEALRLLAAKYSPDYRETAEKYIAGSFGRTEVLRLDIEHVTGKGKRIETK
mgnify:CR=1 FL=1